MALTHRHIAKSQSSCHLVTPNAPASSLARWLGLILLVFLATACTPDLLNPPRLATATAMAQATPTNTPESLILTAPTPTGDAQPARQNGETIAPNPQLTVWINETSSRHEGLLNEMIVDFENTNDVDVELRLVAPMLLPGLVETAVTSDTFTLPDVILHPVEYTAGWAERGILDPAAADQIVTELGRDTFNPAALELVQTNGRPAAIPNDGYQQLIIYRSDWFAEKGLEPPSTHNAMLTAADAISDTQNLVNGFVVPTESNLVSTHHIFEHMALGNGCHLIDDKGEVLLLEDACREALDFYFTIIHNYSPIGVQTDTSTRNAYLEGRTGLIMGPPTLLPMLAGLDPDNQPSCPSCETADFLAQNSGVLTTIRGPNPQATPANFSKLTYLGITGAADTDLALAFARYWFNEGYSDWLAVESERKVPLRWGTAAAPRRFIDQWGVQPLEGTQQSLADLYGDTLVTQLRDGVGRTERWGYDQGQGALITTLYEELTFSIVLQEMLSGYFNTEQTIIEAYRRVTNLIPNYQYLIEITPAPTPTPDN